MSQVEDTTNSNAHSFPNRRAALHLCKVLRTLYKLRSQRGAIHIDPDYTANELDAGLIVSMARWVMAEILRLFWTGSTRDVARAIREIVRYEVPAVLLIDGRPLVLRTDCTVEEEILLLLHNAGEKGMTRTQIGQAVPKSPPAVSTALARLASARTRQVTKRIDQTYVLTPNGAKRVFEKLGDKLRVG